MIKVTVSKVKVKFNSKELNGFGKEVAKSFNKRIQNQTEGFDKLSDRRENTKKRLGYKQPETPLIATGELSKSSSFSNGKGMLKMGYTGKKRAKSPLTNAKLAEFHNNASNKAPFPRRFWIYLNEEQLQLLDTYVKKALGGK